MPTLGGLALEEPERRELALGFDYTQHGLDAQAADQFVLQIGPANVEAEFVQGSRTYSGAGQRTGNTAGLALVAKPKEPVIRAGRAIVRQKTDDAGSTSHGHHRYPLGVQVMAALTGEHLDRQAVAFAFDKDSRRLH